MELRKFQKNISVIFPAYNEGENIVKCVEDANSVLQKLVENFEIIVVDDGSTDGTREKCQILLEKLPKIRIISKPRNEGYGSAIRDGIIKSRYDLVFFSDADGQFDLSDLERLLEYVDAYDVVVGCRKKRLDSFLRKITSLVYFLVIRILFHLPVRDINCAFKVFNKRIFNNIEIISKDYLVSLEILTKVLDSGYSIKEVPVGHFPRCRGKSKISFRDIPRTIDGLVKLYKSRKNK